MAEYIEREAVSHELVIEMVKCIRMTEETKGTMAERVLNRVSEAPAADVVEVVRCRDCKYPKRASVIEGYFICGLLKQTVKDTDFCSYGERKNDD